MGRTSTKLTNSIFDQIVAAAVLDDGMRQAAAVNPADKFKLVFRNLLERLFVERMDQNEEIFVRFMNDRGYERLCLGDHLDELSFHSRTVNRS